MTFTGSTITDLYLVVDRARERDLDRRAARQALDELGDNASFNSLHERAVEIRAELTKLDTFPDSGTAKDPSVRSRTLPDISEAFSSSQPSPSPTTSPITRKAEL